MKYAFTDKAFPVQQRLGPIPERALEPGFQGNRETALGTVDEAGRNMTVQDLPQNPFGPSVAQLEIQGQPPVATGVFP